MISQVSWNGRFISATCTESRWNRSHTLIKIAPKFTYSWYKQTDPHSLSVFALSTTLPIGEAHRHRILSKSGSEWGMYRWCSQPDRVGKMGIMSVTGLRFNFPLSGLGLNSSSVWSLMILLGKFVPFIQQHLCTAVGSILHNCSYWASEHVQHKVILPHSEELVGITNRKVEDKWVDTLHPRTFVTERRADKFHVANSMCFLVRRCSPCATVFCQTLPLDVLSNDLLSFNSCGITFAFSSITTPSNLEIDPYLDTNMVLLSYSNKATLIKLIGCQVFHYHCRIWWYFNLLHIIMDDTLTVILQNFDLFNFCYAQAWVND